VIRPVVGVLALQGAFARHVEALRTAGAEASEIRTAEQLAELDGIVIPGGESTTMIKLMTAFDIVEPLGKLLADGLPVFGTCAGMILLATDVSDGRPDQKSFAAIDIGVRRNGYGRQNQSFSDAVVLDGIDDAVEPFHAVFIRAPRVERVGAEVDVLATYDGDAVLCRQGPVLVSAFHPELSPDRRLHRYFCSLPLSGA